MASQTEENIFIGVVETSTPDQRTAYLDEACAGNTELRQRVEALLRRHEESDGALDVPPPGIEWPDHPAPIVEQAGTVVGRYKLLEMIGEGGFGAVYRAEQEEPIQRTVALKIIKLGMDTQQVIARFEAERQALARMDHPNIAKVLDAGATDAGRPYFVMELIHGTPITEHCDENSLTTRQRIELLIDVCRAVHHAHQKGIIHRDIKPTNVMVTRLDGKSVPKVIDFGIAKATEHRLTEKTVSTSSGQLIGTPQYMSPEQAAFTDADVDTRTDIYSLGVLLYELLTGTTPFEPQRLRGAGYDEVCRIIRETDPPTPSKRLSTLKDATTQVAKRGQVEPGVLQRLLRGDLDRIVMKALEKDRRDRYATAEELAADLRRHLEDKPIRARRPSLADRLSKWSRRHRPLVGSALAVLVVAVLALSVSTLLIARAYHREAAQRSVAEVEARRAAGSEARARESDREAREVVGRIATETAERLEFVPHGQEIRHDMLQQAVEFYNRFLEQRGDDPELQHESALAWLRVGSIRRSMGNTNEASTAYDEAIHRLSELVAHNPSVTSYRADLARSYYSLASLLNYPAHRPQDAVASARQAVDLCEQLVHRHPNNRECRSLYARSCTELGSSLDRFSEAEQAYHQALRAWSKLPGEAPETPEELRERAGTLLKYGGLLRKNYLFLEAEKFMRKALGLLERALNQSPTDFALRRRGVAGTNRSLGKVLAATGRFREAERQYRTAIELREMQMDQYPPLQNIRFGLAMCLRDLSDVLLAVEQVPEAETALRRSLELSDQVAETLSLGGEYEIELGTVHYRLGCLLHHTHRKEDAAAEFTKAQQLLESYLATFPDLASAPRRLVALLATCPDETFRDPARAVKLARTSVERDPENGRWWHLQGVAQLYAGRYHDAVRSFTRSMELRSGGNSFDRLLLAMTYWHLAEKEKARKWYAQAVDTIDNRGWRVTMDFTSLDLERFRAEAEELLGVSKDEKTEHDEKEVTTDAD